MTFMSKVLKTEIILYLPCEIVVRVSEKVGERYLTHS